MTTLHICKIECYNCHQEYNATYKKRNIDGHIFISSPDDFSDTNKDIAKENGVIIKALGYGNPNEPKIFTANICPHCGSPFGNNYIKDLIGKEIKSINLS